MKVSSVLFYNDVISTFFFNDTATTEIYTLSLHDALPISAGDGAEPAQHDLAQQPRAVRDVRRRLRDGGGRSADAEDRKSTRLNSSHANISYAVFCLKKKKYRMSLTISKTVTFMVPFLMIT